MNLPPAFIERIQHQLQDEAADFFRALKTASPVSLRLNPRKPSSMQGKPVPWCSDGVYLESRPSFTLDPLFHAGCYYVQEASSMFLEQVIKQLTLDKIKLLALDACAAPGGKATHLSALLSDESFVVSNETIASRVSVLKENVIKWGKANILLTNNDTSSFSELTGLFDLILIDAPCSGEGLFRKDAEAVNEWSEQNCSLCSGRQQRILANLLPALKEDGILIYCTCTYNPEENEKNIEWLLRNYEMECLSIPVNAEWGIKQVNPNGIIYYSFYPHRLQGEGFFISVLQKKGKGKSISIKKSNKQYTELPKTFSFVQNWIKEEPLYKLYKREDKIFLLPSGWLGVIEFLGKHLRIHTAGTLAGRIKHDNVIPAHELAMSIHLNRSAFSGVQLSNKEALSYLRKEDFSISTSEKGWMLAMYENAPLGWLNNLGNRFNNYYPVDWRIRMKKPPLSPEGGI